MTKTRFSILHLGSLDIPRNENITPETPEIEAEDRRLQIPIYAILIQHKTLGNILFDTGAAMDWRQTWSETFKERYSFKEEYSLIERLRECGLTLDDIDLLIMGHLHFDHAGNLKLFAGLKAGQNVLVGEPEARHAFYEANIVEDGFSGAYIRDEYCGIPGIQYKVMPPGDVELADDLKLIAQKGHTPQVWGIVIKTEDSGNFVLTSDGIHNLKNWEPPVQLPGLCMFPEAYMENIEKMKELVEYYDARVLIGHDFENYNEFKKSPSFYE